jgi:hypothetical protein
MNAAEAEQVVRDRLADLFGAMDEASKLGVDVSSMMGEILRHAIAQAEAAGETVSPFVKMMFS